MTSCYTEEVLNKQELLFTVDEENQPITSNPRSEVHTHGYWHRTTHLWLFNNAKQILCQKRSLLKDINPGKWEAFFGGHVLADQEYIDNAVQEVQEELGITVMSSDMHLSQLYKNEQGKEFQAVYLLPWDVDITMLNLEKEEVEKIAWFDLGELEQLLLKEKSTSWSIMGYENELLQKIQTYS